MLPIIDGCFLMTVKLGGADICLEVSMMSPHVASPHEGHLEQARLIFVHLKKCHGTEVVFDLAKPAIDESHLRHETGHLGSLDTARHQALLSVRHGAMQHRLTTCLTFGPLLVVTVPLSCMM